MTIPRRFRKQHRFVNEYLVDMNGTQAAIRAGYSRKTAGSQGFDLLKKPEIQDALAARWQELQQEAALTPEKVVAEFVRLGFSDIRNYVSWNQDGVCVKDSDRLTPEQSAAVAEVWETTDKDGVKSVRVKLHDKKGSLDSLAKYYKLFQDIAVYQDNRQQTLEIVVVSEDGSRYRYNPAAPRATDGPDPASGEAKDSQSRPALGENHRDSDTSG